MSAEPGGEIDRLLGPFRVELFEVGRILRLLAQGSPRPRHVRFSRGERYQRAEQRRISRIPLFQPDAQRLDDLERVGQIAPRVHLGDDAQELEEQRQIIGHLRRGELEPVHAVGEREVDHRLAAVAALAVAVLVEMERERAWSGRTGRSNIPAGP